MVVLRRPGAGAAPRCRARIRGSWARSPPPRWRWPRPSACSRRAGCAADRGRASLRPPLGWSRALDCRADLRRRVEPARTPRGIVEDAEFPARVVAVGADRDADGLEHAEEFGIPSFTVPFSSFGEPRGVGRRAARADPAVAAGPRHPLRLHAPACRRGWWRRSRLDLINTHPAYLPEFPGAHGVRDALAAGATQTGASLIVVDNGVDAGPIISQERVPVLPGRHRGRACTTASNPWSDGCSSTPSSTSPTDTSTSRSLPEHERTPSRRQPLPRAGRRPHPPGTDLGQRQDRPARPRDGARRRGRRDRLDRHAPRRPSATPATR